MADTLGALGELRRLCREPGFDHSSFGRNRVRLTKRDVGASVRTVVAEARDPKVTSDEQSTVDGTSELVARLPKNHRFIRLQF
jgi:hypothetical protein